MISDRVTEVELPSADRSRLRDSLELVVDGEWEEAAETLRAEYETVCETDSPTGSRAACHLIEE